jgi:hypothetical protein
MPLNPPLVGESLPVEVLCQRGVFHRYPWPSLAESPQFLIGCWTHVKHEWLTMSARPSSPDEDLPGHSSNHWTSLLLKDSE